MEASERRQVESTERALASIDTAEKIGVATAEELERQGEQLDNIENKTDNIHENLDTAQEHITHIQGWGARFKKWLFGKSDKGHAKPTPTSDITGGSQDVSQKHPVPEKGPEAPSQTGDTMGFFETDEVDVHPSAKGPQVAPSPQPSGFKSITNSQDEKAVERNLDAMADGMRRLEGLSRGMGETITVQNEQLDRITGAVDSADARITDQNKQMKKILN